MCTWVLYDLTSQGWCWGTHFIVMGYTRVLLIFRPGKLWCLKATPTECQQSDYRGGKSGWCGKSTAAEWDFGHTLTRVSQQSSESTSLNTHSWSHAPTSSRIESALPLSYPDLHNQFLASSTSSLMYHYHLLASWLSAQHLTHSLSPLKRKIHGELIEHYFPMD